MFGKKDKKEEVTEEVETEAVPAPKEESAEVKHITPKVAEEPKDKKEDWLEGEDDYEGQLTLDVYQDEDNIVIKSTIAGVIPEDLDISINNDMLTIKGKRQQQTEIKEDDYFYQECYWGAFSRSVILPMEVETDKIDAALKDGILTIKLPKSRKAKARKIEVRPGA